MRHAAVLLSFLIVICSSPVVAGDMRDRAGIGWWSGVHYWFPATLTWCYDGSFYLVNNGQLCNSASAPDVAARFGSDCRQWLDEASALRI